MIISYFKGEKDIKRGDCITLAVALSSIPLWVLTKMPFWSVLIVCFIDTIGYLPTVRKSWLKPQEELAVSYLFSCLGAAFSLLAIEQYTPSTWLYPLVLTLTNGTMWLFLHARRRSKAAEPAAGRLKEAAVLPVEVLEKFRDNLKDFIQEVDKAIDRSRKNNGSGPIN